MNFEFKNVNNLNCKYEFILPFSGECGVWTDNNGKVIALIKARGFDDDKLVELYIELFEVRVKNKGFGELCIKDLFNRYKTLERIDGEAKEGSECFWETIGSFFINACDICEDFPSCESDGFACEDTNSSSFLLLREDIVPE